MMKRAFGIHICLLIPAILFITAHPGFAQDSLNKITFENKSGKAGLVKLIGPTRESIEVPDNQSRTVNAAAGQYYILVRYGSDPENYQYSKGDPFEVTQDEKEYSVINITLHKVLDGNYDTSPTTAEEFEAAETDEDPGPISISHRSVTEKIPANDEDKSSWLLYATQDNDTILKIFGKYMETFYNVSPNYKFNDDDKMYLSYESPLSESRKVYFIVYTNPTAAIEKDSETVVTERRIKTSIYIELPENYEDPEYRRKIFELNNRYHSKSWMPHRIFITSDGYVTIQSSINIPGKDFPIHAEQVRDLLVRTLIFLDDYVEEVSEYLTQQ